MTKKRRFALGASLTFLLVSNANAFSDYNGDQFQLIESINKASTISLYKGKELTPPQALNIKKAIDGVSMLKANGQKIPVAYGDMEKHLIGIGGEEITRMHSGRSSVDIGRTRVRMEQRYYTMELIRGTIKLRQALLKLAEENVEVVMPAYTLGVQAQPTTVAHFLSAYAAGLARVSNRSEALYGYVNQSPLGAGVLGASSFNNDRAYLGALLGFDGVVENAFDAVQLSSLDLGMDIMGVTSGAVAIAGQLAADLLVQYRTPHPWFIFDADGKSTAMPQKRNPESLSYNALPMASSILALQTAFALKATNLPQGFPHVYIADEPTQALKKTAELLKLMADIVSTVKVDRERARKEVADEYSTATSLAEVLQKDGGLPYRIGYYYTADLVGYMRANGIKVLDISFADAKRIFAEVAEKRGFSTKKLPLTEQQFRIALSPEGMLQGRVMTGGTQANAVKALLRVEMNHVSQAQKWLEKTTTKLQQAEKALATAYGQLGR